MKILHLIDTGGPGGAETVYADLAEGLTRRGHQSITVVPERDWLDEELRRRGLEPLLMSGSAMDVSMVRRLRSVVRREGVDVVQTHLLGSGVYATLACADLPVPVVCTFHGHPDISSADPLIGLKTRILARRLNRVVCVSESLAEAYRASRLFVRPLRIIENGVDVDAVTAEAPADLREELGLAEESFIAAAVGNVRHSKGYEHLLSAVAKASKAVPALQIVIAGQYDPQGALFVRLKDLSSELGVTDRVHFLGFREDVFAVLKGADTFVLSSIDEGFSLATVQALLCGTPAILTRSGGPENIAGSVPGPCFVDPASPEQLAEAIGAVHRLGAEARLRMGQAPVPHIEARFGLERMVDRYEQLYRDAVTA